jgi:hypothetical protein
MECKYCKHEFKNKSVLNKHVNTAKYCLIIQGVEKNNYLCEACGLYVSSKGHYTKHISTCKDYIIMGLKKEIIELRTENKILCSRVNTKTIINTQNNIFANLDTLNLEDIKKYSDKLTLAHHKMGAEGYATYALEYPLKNRLCIKDRARKIFKYKNEDGKEVIDVDLHKIFGAIAKSVAMSSYNIAQDHYQELSKDFTVSEMEACPTLEWALSLAKYGVDSDDKFCSDIKNEIRKQLV